MNNKKEIPLDWKIELDKETNKMMTHALKIMEIIQTLPNKTKEQVSYYGGVKVTIEKMDKHDDIKYMNEETQYGGVTESKEGSPFPL